MKQICVVNLRNPVHLTQTANISNAMSQLNLKLGYQFEYEKMSLRDDLGQ